MEKEKEKVSIIIPVYNVEKYVEKCIYSVLNQTYKNIEIVIVNDGSIDNSSSLIEKIIKEDKRIIYINQRNKGISESRNIGIKKASGKFIAFVDSDDWLEESFIERLIENAKEYDLVISSYYKEFTIGKERRFLNISGVYSSSFIQRRIVGLLDSELSDPSQADSLVTIWAKLYKKDIIDDNSIEFISLKKIGTAEDLLFNLAYLEYTNKVYVIDEPLYHYRKDNTESLTTTYKKDLFNNWINLFNEIYKVIEFKNEKIKIAFYNRISLSIIGLGLNEMGNTSGFINRYKNINYILNNDIYIKSYSKLDFSYFYNSLEAPFLLF